MLRFENGVLTNKFSYEILNGGPVIDFAFSKQHLYIVHKDEDNGGGI